MYVKRVIKAYQTSVNTTTPMLDTMIELFNEMSNVLSGLQQTIGQQDNERTSESLKNLQYALFELMAVINHDTEEGERLFLVYVSLNQTLVTVQLHKRYELLSDVHQQVELLAEAWTEVRQNQRRHRYTTNKL